MMPFRPGQIWPFSEDVKILENPSSVILYLRKTKCMVTKIINYWPLDQALGRGQYGHKVKMYKS